MNTELLPRDRLSPQAHAALMDAAKQRAIELRCEAIQDLAASLARRFRALWQRKNASRISSPMET